ncbi:LOW QUALITY PROTEIN: arf-GAP domain and FG repeat-containing protein 1-like [Paramacrobiotus metropolitanus]|uniref:LOW QUALITY PROTEIN: arf-GAP domain and FG repeat-containing protein 1-like n=1 Tax=Paramacrobiotus metropolitanus TaxID=2943436 RepID=UPI002445F16F|nr:LOW QUALITY PROTEIN: arf-GAP domain and FG repeat-containing protein 1-like [Paramacrobiotus metropolitanus]
MTAKNASKTEQFSKLIRQISQLPHNKNCFDCGQKGPTYVDLTIGAFVCTGCSGILRGLNPPHRVKSISMGTFAEDEVKFMQFRGNAFCKKVWLFNYDPQTNLRPPEVRDDQKMKDFLIAKYEKKRWYSGPNELNIGDQLKQDDTGSYKSLTEMDTGTSLSRRASSNSQRSLRHDSQLSNGGSPLSTGNGTSNQPRTHSTGSISLPRSHTANAITHNSDFPAPAAVSSNTDDLLGVFGGLSVASTPAPVAVQPQMPVAPTFPAPHRCCVQFQRLGQFRPLTDHAVVAAVNGSLPFHDALPQSHSVPFNASPFEPAKPMQPMSVMAPTPKAVSPAKSVPNNPAPAKTASDKYAALAELDEMFHGGSAGSTPQNSLPKSQGQDGFGASWSGAPQNPANTFVRPTPSWPAAPVSQQSNPFGYTNAFQAPVKDGWGAGAGAFGGGNTASAFDSSNVWGQMPAYGGQTQHVDTATNPFLLGPTPNAGFGQPKQGVHPTNPFL